jgi:anti-sigma28 factor (negative regulator of flagellin synthesis)
VLFVVAGGFALLMVYRISLAARSGYEPMPPQDAIRLETRINQLEQRLYTIETSIRSLEQQSRIGSVTSRTVTPEDVAALRAEIQTLELRLADEECAIAKLDERTLTPAARAARQRSGARTEPCRLSPETPVRLPERR